MAIRDEGIYDFYYVSLVTNKCLWANQRVFIDYNLYELATVFWDGGYLVDNYIDNVPEAKAAYEASIIDCEARSVADIDAALTVHWIDEATMNISVSVQNNEATQYDGYIRVFVTENESSLGWLDTWDNPYTYCMLDNAFDEDCTIPAGEIWENSTTWDGAEHESGHGEWYDGITADNITIIAAIYNDEWHQGYSYPPSTNPFDAYYVDETTGATPIMSFFPVDDEDAEFIQLKGDWNSFQHSSAYDGTLHFTRAGTGEKKAAWRVDTIIDPDTYDVYVWKFEHEYMGIMADNVGYRVAHAYGISDWIYVDQSSPGDEWVHLGQFAFDNSHAQGVIVTDNANGFVIADAIKLVRTLD